MKNRPPASISPSTLKPPSWVWAEATPVAILLQPGVEPYRAALAARPGLLVAPAPPPAAVARDSPGYLLVVGSAEQATLEIDGASIRLVGPEVRPLDVGA